MNEGIPIIRFPYDAVSHSALEILTDNRTEPPDRERVHLSIRSEIASLDRLGAWLKNTSETLRWTNGTSENVL